VFDRFVLARFVRRSGRAALDRKDDSPTLTFCPSLTLISSTTPPIEEALRSRLVGFEFHHGLAFGDASAGLDHQAH